MDSQNIRERIERILGQTWEEHASEFHRKVVDRLHDEVRPILEDAGNQVESATRAKSEADTRAEAAERAKSEAERLAEEARTARSSAETEAASALQKKTEAENKAEASERALAEVRERAENAERSRDEAQARIQTAEQARSEAEARVTAAEEAKTEAEARAVTENRAKIDMEQTADAEAKARAATEARAESEAQARAAAEKRVKTETEARKRAEEELAHLKAQKGHAAPAPAEASSEKLNGAAAAILETSGQADILEALLNGVTQFAARSALFVLKGGEAKGWQARGFENSGAMKGWTLAIGQGLTASAIQSRRAAAAAATEFDERLISEFGAPADGKATAFPLLVRDKVAAILYADAGKDAGGKFDQPALELLVRVAGSWLENVAARKAGAAAPAEAEAAEAAAAKSVPEPVAQAEPEATPEPRAAEHARPAIAPEDEGIHQKAKKYAKLLVDEIVLYNKAKVTEGRHKKDLYDRLKEDIEKSRASYQKRYGQTAAASGDYFNDALIRILAANDASVLGSNFPR